VSRVTPNKGFLSAGLAYLDCLPLGFLVGFYSNVGFSERGWLLAIGGQWQCLGQLNPI
jgi:hypothetical protein